LADSLTAQDLLSCGQKWLACLTARSTGLFHLPGISQTLRTRLLTAHCRLTLALPG
jgi:hypothetical protein